MTAGRSRVLMKFGAEIYKSKKGRGSSGFTYPILLVALVVLTIAAETATRLTSTVVRRDTEQELLFRGMAYRQAIKSYYTAIPERPSYPRTIDDLLSDPRFQHRRHLRQAYPDPTGGRWRLILTEGERIMGVASRSKRAPLTKAHLPREMGHFADEGHLSDWEFVFSPD